MSVLFGHVNNGTYIFVMLIVCIFPLQKYLLLLLRPIIPFSSLWRVLFLLSGPVNSSGITNMEVPNPLRISYTHTKFSKRNTSYWRAAIIHHPLAPSLCCAIGENDGGRRGSGVSVVFDR